MKLSKAIPYGRCYICNCKINIGLICHKCADRQTGKVFVLEMNMFGFLTGKGLTYNLSEAEEYLPREIVENYISIADKQTFKTYKSGIQLS